jgi:hypothetical protein
MTRNQLIALLTKVQNSAENFNRDIMTIAAMCDFDELKTHFAWELNRLKDEARKREIRGQIPAVL